MILTKIVPNLVPKSQTQIKDVKDSGKKDYLSILKKNQNNMMPFLAKSSEERASSLGNDKRRDPSQKWASEICLPNFVEGSQMLSNKNLPIVPATSVPSKPSGKHHVKNSKSVTNSLIFEEPKRETSKERKLGVPDSQKKSSGTGKPVGEQGKGKILKDKMIDLKERLSMNQQKQKRVVSQKTKGKG
jgi:hypothetical protein